jgi:tetratricopeptide (TPR) repeat protein
VARRGAQVLGEEATGPTARSPRDRRDGPPPAGADWTPDVWIEDRTRPPTRAAKAAQATGRRTRRPRPLPDEVRAELAAALGRRAAALEPRLAEAVRAYEADRYDEARRLLRTVADAAPGVAAVRELLGLTLYRMGRWRGAIKELEAFHALTGSFDQHPVLADAHRALRHWGDVARLWDELRKASPGADVVAEGRIVAAGALADRGDVAGAIRLLEQGPVRSARPRPHHLRLWYATADLYERAGDLPRARRLFGAILRHDPDFVDVAERLAALG